MSRVGKQPIAVPDQVTVRLDRAVVTVEGPKGSLSLRVPVGVGVSVADKVVTVARANDSKTARSLHGLIRTLVHNMVVGVTAGFSKELELQGVGLKAQVDQSLLTLSLGFSHPVTYQIPAGVTVETPKPTQMVVRGTDKALVGQVAATIRNFYEAEPYKGTGIRYVGEIVRRKAGKAVATKGAA
ncbi:MAG: 50S ribosomal protein L6 [Omnitrophica WOR_2 bacterium RIFCSPHIGHO2_02_FULL_68_15]|nr:MAG: 50S ribosomal protein L6 [Omnitrophica WOR_2 bacterium RIFCSPHIGHO2_02_FULL_68_15]